MAGLVMHVKFANRAVVDTKCSSGGSLNKLDTYNPASTNFTTLNIFLALLSDILYFQSFGDF